jgi:hypothetical protein
MYYQSNIVHTAGKPCCTWATCVHRSMFMRVSSLCTNTFPKTFYPRNMEVQPDPLRLSIVSTLDKIDDLQYIK